ncbi:F-box/kelch-repeat protein [Raphanus sativus]|uniref:F-box/kelch-repeat protein At5g39560-like n=1 Tax=Raphanus sativus TaxID=3726 RepID=A0A6J0MB67_RAPSA|nr:F-box/kelch-repeat protein At5g39560-like [Raphanus sativus]KAJ4913402.1 F-box/kelch-repeat protein [Raphanus sativus]
MISQEVEPTEKRKKTIPEPPSTLFSSLPPEIVENILARVSRWAYPRLSLVSKSFRSLLSPLEIYKTRSEIGVNETCFYVCLKLPNQSCASWFSLWTEPNKRTKRRGKTTFKRDSSGNSVVPTPFSSFHSPPFPRYIATTVGSEIYIIGGPDGEPSSSVRILDCRNHTWRDGPNMTVARDDAYTALHDGKIYVIGGCDIDAYSTNWIEVFDVRTQSWTALPGPGPDADEELRRAYYFIIVNVCKGKIYVETIGKYYTYEPKDGTWKLVRERSNLFFSNSVEAWCEMENVLYCCTELGYLMWSTTEIEGREWREIKGLDKLREHLKSGNEFEMANYGGKLLVMWCLHSDLCMRNKIWYAKICLESRGNGREVWGKVECVDMLTFPVETYKRFCCLTASV